MTANAYQGTDNLEVMEDAVNYNRFLVSLILKANASRVPLLDFGAGVGTFARYLAADGLEVDCVEPDPTQAQMIGNVGLRVFNSIESVPANQYRFIYSFNVLEHIDDDRYTLAELYRVLQPGGSLLIYVPAFQVLYSSMDQKVGHVRRYQRADLIEKVRGAGFEVVYVKYADCLGFLATLAFKYLGDASGRISRRSVWIYDRLLFPLSALLDGLLHRWVGKNLTLFAIRPGNLRDDDKS